MVKFKKKTEKIIRNLSRPKTSVFAIVQLYKFHNASLNMRFSLV